MEFMVLKGEIMIAVHKNEVDNEQPLEKRR